IPLSLYNAEDLTAQLSACAAVPDLRQPAQNMMQAHPGERPPPCYTTKPMEHHGIIPTGKVPDLNAWPAKKADLFRECAKALVIALHPAATFNTLKVEGIVHVEGMAEETPSAFKKGFEQLVNAGWLEVAGGEIPSRDPIPSILAGSSILIQSVEVSAKRTNPPKPF